MIVSVDVGKQGGIALLDENLSLESSYKMPLKENGELDVKRIWAIFGRSKTLVIERQHVRSTQGGALTIGKNYGKLLAIGEVLDMEIIEVSPVTWTKKLLKEYSHITDKKERGIQWCKDKGYDVPKKGKTDRGKKYHDGVADAICIGYWYLTK